MSILGRLATGENVRLVEELSNGGSAGNLRKWIVNIGCDFDTRYYVKCASVRSGFVGYEPESECIAYKIGKLLGVSCVRYTLNRLYIGNSDYKICISRDFVNQECSYQHYLGVLQGIYRNADITKYYGKDKYDLVVRALPKFQMILNNILVFDYIIGNKDRHLRNLGLLKDINGVIAHAPVFDSGDSLFADESIKMIQVYCGQKQNNVHSKPFADPHFAQLRLVSGYTLNKVQKADIYRLVNRYLKGERAKCVNKWLILRLQELGLLW